MEVKRLNSHAFRIYISFDELMEREIDLPNLYSSEPVMQDGFVHLLTDAMNQSGLKIEPFAADRFEIKLEPFSEGLKIWVKTLMAQSSIQSSRPKNEMNLTYSFETFDNILNCVKRFPHLPRSQSTIYYFDHAYFLFVKNLGEYAPAIHALLTEYGQRIQAPKVFLDEYAKVLIDKNAFKELSQM